MEYLCTSTSFPKSQGEQELFWGNSDPVCVLYQGWFHPSLVTEGLDTLFKNKGCKSLIADVGWGNECNPSHSEETKPESRIRGAAPPVPSATEWSLPLRCWPHYFWYRPWYHLATLAHFSACWDAVNQHQQVLFLQADFQSFFPHSIALHGIVVTQVQDLTHGLIEPYQWP